MNNGKIDRRAFLKATATLPLATAAGLALESPSTARAVHAPGQKARIKLSCNLYSFNIPLRNGQMTLDQVLEFCSNLGFDAVDPTAYYFPNYPELPKDEYVYHIKRKAFQLGLDISGTGVRNDFTLPESEHRKAEVEKVKKWVGFTARLGAPVLRVFAGKGEAKGHSEEEVQGWVVESLRECTDFAAKQGVMIVLQNHADFIQKAEQVLRILRLVNSEWLAVNLDTGSFRIGDPYAEIAKVAPFAATWQIKEKIFVNGKEETADLKKLIRIVEEAGYRGYLPIETLGEGDPRLKVPKFFDEVKRAMGTKA